MTEMFCDGANRPGEARRACEAAENARRVQENDQKKKAKKAWLLDLGNTAGLVVLFSASGMGWTVAARHGLMDPTLSMGLMIACLMCGAYSLGKFVGRWSR